MTVLTTCSQNGSIHGPYFQGYESEARGKSGAVKDTMKNQGISRMQDIRGFSLMEILLVAGLLMLVGGFSMMIIGPALEARNVEMAVRTVSTQMSRARQISVDARRQTRVTFTTPSTITVEASQGGTWTPVSTVELPGDMELGIDGSVPGAPAPGGSTYANNQVADFSGYSELFFMPDGSAVTSAGALTNGVVYMAQPSKLDTTTRAVTIFGSTGRMKRWAYILDLEPPFNATWE